jgi:hypothetical protein
MAKPNTPKGLWTEDELRTLDGIVRAGLLIDARNAASFPGRALDAIKRKAARRRAELGILSPTLTYTKPDTVPLSKGDFDLRQNARSGSAKLEKACVALYRAKALADRVTPYQAMVRVNFAPDIAAEYERRIAA